ncbi:MAG: FG-GAP repeat domain-containing protein, partial [Acidobacteriota bacterium]
MNHPVHYFTKFKRLKSVFILIFILFPLFLWGSIHFTDVTQRYNVRGYSCFRGHGVCWVDVNNDGRLDLYIKNHDFKSTLMVKNILYINEGDIFLDEALERGVADAYPFGTHGAVFADLDNDKDFDLFSTSTYEGISPSFNHIYKNDGIGYFQDITDQISPPQDRDTASRGVAAADFDGDGDIDLYFSNPLSDPNAFSTQPSLRRELKNFYINNGDGTFTWEYRGIDWDGFAQGVSAVDIDQDGDIDIVEAKWASPSTIYLNDGNGYFHKAGASLGLPQTINIRDNGMIFADVDNDGDLDLAVIGDKRIALYKNQDGIFQKYSEMSTAGNKPGFHCCFGDFDHDGDLDLYESGGYIYQNDGQGNFSSASLNLSALMASLKTADPRGSALGDFDNDGDLD